MSLSRKAALAICKGDEFAPQELEQLRISDELERAWPAAARFLEVKDRTEAEVRQRLKINGYSSEVVNFIVDRLKKDRYLDDERFARRWVENRNELHPRGHRIIRRELLLKGIDETCITRSLGNAESETELAKRLADKLSRHKDFADFKEMQTRVGAAMARKGFSYSIIRPVLLDLWEKRSTEK